MANKGSFTKGRRKRNQGGKRPGAGRPTKEQRALKIAAEKRARERLEEKVDAIMDEYLRLATGGRMKRGESPATLRHAVDKILPPVEKVVHAGNVIFKTNLPEEKD